MSSEARAFQFGKRLALGERGVLAGRRYVEQHVAQLEREGYSAGKVDFQAGAEISVELFFANTRAGGSGIVIVEFNTPIPPRM